MELLGLFIILLIIGGLACIAIAFTSYSKDELIPMLAFIIIGIIFLMTALPLKEVTVEREANFSVTHISLNDYRLVSEVRTIKISNTLGDFELGEIVRLKYSEKPFGVIEDTIEIVESEN